MEDNPRLLWGYVETALRPRRTASDATWLQNLNRIWIETRRALELPPGPPLARESCGILNEHWSREQLARTPRAVTPAVDPPPMTPLIAVRLSDGSCVLIDGAARAEHLLAEEAAGPCSVVVIVPQ